MGSNVTRTLWKMIFSLLAATVMSVVPLNNALAQAKETVIRPTVQNVNNGCGLNLLLDTLEDRDQNYCA
jgi:hypothetical protein